MQAFKIEHFERERGSPFPPFSTLSRADCDALRQRLVQGLKLPLTVDGLDLVQTVASREGRSLSTVAESPNFDLHRELAALGIRPAKSVYLNWYRYDDIDEMQFDDLSKNFDDIWYPSSDDLDVFDDTLQWILSIDHGGHAKVIEL